MTVSTAGLGDGDPMTAMREYHEVRPGTRLAVACDGPTNGERCGLFWLGGLKSAMDGTKAGALARRAAANDRHIVRFDYSGHGASDGSFEDGTISLWLEEAAAVFERYATGRRVVVGSSMGGWLAVLLAARLPAERVAGLALVAPAADMTETLMWRDASAEMREAIARDGVYQRPSRYGDGPYPITRALIEDGRRHLMLEQGMDVHCPVRILHGEADPDVPWRHGLALHDALRGDDVTFTLVKGGDHRLSRDADIALLGETAEALCRRADAAAQASTAPASAPRPSR